METPPVRESQVDRRWYPTGDPVEWARSARQAVFDSVTRCIADVLAMSVHPGAPDRLLASDRVFQELNVCVDVYARGLFALGRTLDGVSGLILAAAREAAAPRELHPAIIAAIEQWCREVHDATR